MVVIEETYLPISISVPEMSDERFQEFCDQYRDFGLEYTSDGYLHIMPPSDRKTSARNAFVSAPLLMWAQANKNGAATESQGGYKLPDGSRLSPDASWTSKRRLSDSSSIPEFIVEVLSPSDRVRTLEAKMQDWVANGIELAWMIDPFRRTVTIYRQGQEPEKLYNPARVYGDGPIEGFVLETEHVWEPWV